MEIADNFIDIMPLEGVSGHTVDMYHKVVVLFLLVFPLLATAETALVDDPGPFSSKESPLEIQESKASQGDVASLNEPEKVETKMSLSNSVPLVSSEKAENHTFNQPFIVEQLDRMALTPTMTGKINEAFWDQLSHSNGLDSYFQWSPGVLYAAAKVPVGRDLIVTYCLGKQHWFSGKDNIEIRVRWIDSKLKVAARRLDTSDPNQPRWINDSILTRSIRGKGSRAGDFWKAEFKLLGVALPKIKRETHIGLRFDTVMSGEPTPAPNMPRAIRFVTLKKQRSSNFPQQMSWDVNQKHASVTPGQKLHMKLNIKDLNKTRFDKVYMHSKGFSESFTSTITCPYPAYNKKGKIALTYETSIPEKSLTGWRILKTSFQNAKGEATLLERSFLVEDPVSVKLSLPSHLVQSEESQVIKGSIHLRSHSNHKLKGRFSLEVPKDWSAVKGKEKNFQLISRFLGSKIQLELVAPKNVFGLIPLRYSITVDGKEIHKTLYLPIRPRLEA